MKPILGWTMLSREEMRQVERSLAGNDQDTRDEIGFLLIHQGFANRFFPGTSVLHTRVRYSLFVPWLYLRAASSRQRGTDLNTRINRLLVELAQRLKTLGGEPVDVIGGDKLGQLTSQPPDRVYWTALRAWGLLLPSVDTRAEVLRRLRMETGSSPLDDDGERPDDESVEVFSGLPDPPKGWDNPQSALHFEMPRKERDFLRRKLSRLPRPGEDAPALLACIVNAGDSFSDTSTGLPKELDAQADASDRLALNVARDAAALSAIGRAVYGALVEKLLADDGGPDEGMFRAQLSGHFATYGEAAGRCDLDALEALLPDLPPYVEDVLRQTREYARNGKPGRFLALQECYRKSEVERKTSQRARLIPNSERSAERRAEWDPKRHNTTPLHYRWHIVHKMLADLKDSA